MKPNRPLQNQEQSQTRPPKKAGGRYKFKVRVKGAQLKLAATNSTATSETKEPARRRRYRVKVKVKGAQLKLAATDSKLPLTMGFRFSCARRSSSWRRCRRAWMRLI